MLDHIFLTVSDIDHSVAFYSKVLAPIGITTRLNYAGKDGPPGHPDLYGFGADGHMFFWLRSGRANREAVHVGFVANSEAAVIAAHAAGLSAGGREIHPPGPQLHYDPRYYAAQIADPDGYSVEFVFKSWQH